MKLRAITVMATVTGALAAWTGFAAGAGRWTLAAAFSVLCLFAGVIVCRIAWSVIDTLVADTPASIEERNRP